MCLSFFCSLAKFKDEIEVVAYNSPEAIRSAKSMSAVSSIESVFPIQTLDFKKISDSGIDADMLRQRQDILFYDEIILYEVRYVELYWLIYIL